jgi:hypothetical protein
VFLKWRSPEAHMLVYWCVWNIFKTQTGGQYSKRSVPDVLDSKASQPTYHFLLSSASVSKPTRPEGMTHFTFVQTEIGCLSSVLSGDGRTSHKQWFCNNTGGRGAAGHHTRWISWQTTVESYSPIQTSRHIPHTRCRLLVLLWCTSCSVHTHIYTQRKSNKQTS